MTHENSRGVSDVSRRHITSVNVPGCVRSLRLCTPFPPGPQPSPATSWRSHFPGAGRTSKAWPPAHAASSPPSVPVKSCSRRPRGCTTSATSPSWPGQGCTAWTAPATCAMCSTLTRCCAASSPITPAPSSRPKSEDLADVLRREFEPLPQPLADALTCCDMTTSPDGKPMNVGRRLAEIRHRYGSGHLVSRSIRRATPMILRAVGEVHARAASTS